MRIRRPTKRQMILGCLGLLGVVLLLYLAAFPAVEYYAFHIYTPPYSDLTPAKRAEMNAKYRAWLTERIHLPPEALNPQPYSPEMQDAVREFDSLWLQNKIALLILLDLNGSSKDTVSLPPSVGPQIAPFVPFMDAFTSVVRRPDYSFGALASTWVRQGTDYIDYVPPPEPTPDYFALTAVRRLLQVRASVEIQARQTDEALRDAETLLLAAKTDAHDVRDHAYLTMEFCILGIETENAVLRPCNYPALLRHALEVQNSLVNQLGLFSDRSVWMNRRERIGSLREFKRRGVQVDYQDRTGYELERLYYESEAAFIQTVMLPAAQADRDGQLWQEQRIPEFQAEACLYGAPPRGLRGLGSFLLGRPLVPLTFVRYSYSFESWDSIGIWTTRADNVLVQLDLLRLNTARHLYTIEKGKAPDTIGDLVPEYLPEQPADRFAKEKQPIRETGGVYYSVGPDGEDDKSEIVYDPSNGTKSRGDILLRTLDWTAK